MLKCASRPGLNSFAFLSMACNPSSVEFCSSFDNERAMPPRPKVIVYKSCDELFYDREFEICAGFGQADSIKNFCHFANVRPDL